MADVTTIHRHNGNEQVTTKVIWSGAVTYRFLASPDGDLEEFVDGYQGDGDAPEQAVAALEEHFANEEDDDAAA